MECLSNSKVNIGLKILNQRDDEFHNIFTVFQELDFGDSIQLEKAIEDCNITSDVDWIPTDEYNICHKAFSILKKICPGVGGVSIHINKNIPIGSGLGGGSANGAAVLKGINKLYGLSLSNRELEQAGIKLGADVPFFINGGTQLGEGIGTKLTPLSNTVEGKFLLVIPEISISTLWAYNAINKKLKSNEISPNITSFLSEDISSFKFFENDFEKIVIPAYPEIGAIKQKLLELGARFASLSGSGSTVFGIFDDDASAKEAELFFRPLHQTIIANPA